MTALRFWPLLAAFALAGCDVFSPKADWPEPSPALWEVSSAEGHKAWLFGTVHVLPDGVEWDTETLASSLAAADLLIVEIANLGDGAAAQAAFEELAYTPGLGAFRGRQRTGWGSGERSAFDSKVDALIGTNRSVLQTDIEDWAAALQIASLVTEGDPANGVDRALLASDKPRMGLETYASQFAIFDALSPADQQQFLDAVVFEESETDASTMNLAWLTGNLAELESMSITGILADAEVREALLTARNQRWVGQIAPLIRAGREPFVAVGAAHMLSDEGLPALLAAQGFTVKRIQ